MIPIQDDSIFLPTSVVLSLGRAQEIFELLERNESELQFLSGLEHQEQQQRERELVSLPAKCVVRRIREKGITLAKSDSGGASTPSEQQLRSRDQLPQPDAWLSEAYVL